MARIGMTPEEGLRFPDAAAFGASWNDSALRTEKPLPLREPVDVEMQRLCDDSPPESHQIPGVFDGDTFEAAVCPRLVHQAALC